MTLRDRQKPKPLRKPKLVGPHGIGCTCGESEEGAAFTVGFSSVNGERSVGVFVGDLDADGDDGPIFVIPIRGELTTERKDLISERVLDALNACLDIEKGIPGTIEIIKITDSSSEDPS